MKGDQIQTETNKRRTFAIISHPDAGKTTLTEKLLLFGGAIREAGAVKGKKSQRHATSDWMEIEKKRGISVTSTVLQFRYKDCYINILDTPGHEDFSEDTYRTLSAADSAVMLIDAAKGIESQTLKLFEVCRMRRIPIFTFVNKLDRESKDPFALLKEIEDVLGVQTYPINWPAGTGADFKGIYDRTTHAIDQYTGRGTETPVLILGPQDAQLEPLIGRDIQEKLVEDISLLDVAGDTWDPNKIHTGELTPVFFGSAITSFGVRAFLDHFIELAPVPSARTTTQGLQESTDAAFSGFVFKIQANMNPAHRDRVAFIRICSGKFVRGMSVRLVRTDKSLNLSQPQQFFAQERTVIEEAFPGDIIGVFDPGIFRIGDTLCEKGSFEFEKLPQFSPEHFARITMRDTAKHKQFHKGLQQLSEEGAIQVFRIANRTEDMILGVVGRLQFEVFEYRMQAEYGTNVLITDLSYRFARWLPSNSVEGIRYDSSSCLLVSDQDDRWVLLFTDEFALRWVISKNPETIFYTTSYEVDAKKIT